MGFESKLFFKMNAQIQKRILHILETQNSFYRKAVIGGHLNFEFRANKNSAGMPDITAIIEEDGLYICQYGSPKTWDGTKEIINFLHENNIDYRFEEI